MILSDCRSIRLLVAYHGKLVTTLVAWGDGVSQHGNVRLRLILGNYPAHFTSLSVSLYKIYVLTKCANKQGSDCNKRYSILVRL